jgi:hypothetical protein
MVGLLIESCKTVDRITALKLFLSNRAMYDCMILSDVAAPLRINLLKDKLAEGTSTADGRYKKHQEKEVYQVNLLQYRPKGRPKDGWKNEGENEIRKMGIVNWRQVAQDGDGMRRATGEAVVLLG